MNSFYNISPTNHGWGFGYGFFSNYRICLEQLILHYESGGIEIPYINWGKTTWVEGFNPFESEVCNSNENPFNWWFDQQIPDLSDNIKYCRSSPRPDIIDHAQHYFNKPNELNRQQLVDKLYIKPKVHIINEINRIYEKEFIGHVVLGVMARGSEYNFRHPMYGIFEIKDYIKEIEKTLKKYPEITKIFIVSEESEYVDEIAKAFPNSYYMPDAFRRTDETMEYVNRVHCWCNVSTKRENHCQKLGEEVIIQTKLLGKSNYLFGRFCGILAGAVLWNENLKNVIVL
jgi:hypothetical protein